MEFGRKCEITYKRVEGQEETEIEVRRLFYEVIRRERMGKLGGNKGGG